jgi:hypothetical protein
MEVSMVSSTVAAKDRMLAFLQKTDGYNTFSVKQAQRRFGVQNVSARISELRQAGYPIYTNIISRNGEKVAEYRLGTPTRNQRKNRFYSRLRSK